MDILGALPVGTLGDAVLSVARIPCAGVNGTTYTFGWSELLLAAPIFISASADDTAAEGGVPWVRSPRL